MRGDRMFVDPERASDYILSGNLRWLLQCWLRWPPGRHEWLMFNDCRICSRCGVMRNRRSETPDQPRNGEHR